jgi:adenylate kinase family enzyme
MKIGICGPMCSGKTTIANYIVSKDNSFYITSFAKKLKEIAVELFNMKQKDRELLIIIGKKMREIDENVFVNSAIKDCQDYENVIIDDIRYENELNKLKEYGWITIKLIISEELQLKRLKKTYPESWETHYKYIKDNSEKTYQLKNDDFDIVVEITEEDQNKIFSIIDKLFQ